MNFRLKNNRLIRRAYELLLGRFGAQGWWPGDSPFEVAIGAILTQNTAWSNVEKAIQNLKRVRRLEPRAMLSMPKARLAELIRPAGYFNLKAARLKEFLKFLSREGALDLEMKALCRYSTDELRDKLLAVKGIGPETADSILLYAFDRPVFVIDAYTKRIFSRHFVLTHDDLYEEFQEIFEGALERERGLFNEYHALIVALGKDFCKPKARCAECPLKDLPRKRGV